MYRCLNCGRDLTFEDMSGVPLEEYAKKPKRPKLRCPACSYWIFRKLRPDVVKTLGAR